MDRWTRVALRLPPFLAPCLLHFQTIISSLLQSHSRSGDRKPPPSMSHFHLAWTISARIICIPVTDIQSREYLPCPAHFVMTSSLRTSLHIVKNFRITSRLTRVFQAVFGKTLYRCHNITGMLSMRIASVD